MNRSRRQRRHGDLTLIQGVVNTLVMFLARIIGHTVDRVVFKTERGYGFGYYAVTIVAELALGFLASIIVFWFSRWREYRADAAGASLTTNGHMIAALQRCSRSRTAPGPAGELTAFGISEQLRQGVGNLFRSHPPLEDRIRALRGPDHVLAHGDDVDVLEVDEAGTAAHHGTHPLLQQVVIAAGGVERVIEVIASGGSFPRQWHRNAVPRHPAPAPPRSGGSRTWTGCRWRRR